MKLRPAFLICMATALLPGHSMSWDENELLIWLKNDMGTEGLKKLGDNFTKATGKKVTVVVADNNQLGVANFHQQVVLERGPDIFIWPHDRIGEWAQAGFIASVTPNMKTLNAIDQTFWDAVSYNGSTYGYPISVEGPTQICNRKLVSNTFEDYEDIEEAAPGLRSKGVWPYLLDYNNTYFMYGMLTAGGAYAFWQDDDGYDTADTGINHSGAIVAGNLIQRYISQSWLPDNIDYGFFDDAFKEGKAACIINGPWSWAGYREAGIDMIVGPYPALGIRKPSGFLGVVSAVINNTSPNKDLAAQFLEDYLLNERGLKMMDDDVPLGATAHRGFMNSIANRDPILDAAFEAWQQGEPMPNIPKMSKFWVHSATALKEISQQKRDPLQALNDAAERITR